MGSSEIVEQSRLSLRRDAAKLALIAITYFLAHQICVLLPGQGQGSHGDLAGRRHRAAALLLCPRRLWPAILITLFGSGYSADLLAGRPAVSSLGFMIANVLESIACAWCMTQWCGRSIRFARVKEISALVFSVTVLNAGTACLGAGTAELAHATTFSEFWLTWWISDGLGILLVAPLIVTLSTAQGPLWGIRLDRAIEWILFMAVWIVAAWLTFEPRFIDVPPHPYMLMALLAWPALRLGRRTVSLALISLAVVAIASKTVSTGPSIWGGKTLATRLLDIQTFLGFAGIGGYLLAATNAEVRSVLDDLRQSEERFRLITSGSPDHVLVQDRNLRYTFVLNPQLGLTEKDMVGKTDHDLLARADADNLTILKKRVLASGNPVHGGGPARQQGREARKTSTARTFPAARPTARWMASSDTSAT